MRPRGRRVLVTHADEPVGRRLVKTLFHDEDVERIWAVGAGPAPRLLSHYLRTSNGRLRYARVDLARHRPTSELFGSPSLRAARIDTVVHLPRHGATASPGSAPPMLAGVSVRTAEARLVLQHSLESPDVRQLVTVGSAFVYRLAPGNANRFTEESALDLDPGVCPEVRSWIDCDMIFHGEIRNEKLRVALLRAPTVVASGGAVFLNPALSGPGEWGVRPLGFDPLWSLISDKDLVRAIRLAMHRRRRGVFNVAGRESVPLSVLARWTGGHAWPVPGPLLSGASAAARLAGGPPWPHRIDGPHLRYGFTLDTRRAERELGYRPAYRIDLSLAGDGRLRLETAPA